MLSTSDPVYKDFRNQLPPLTQLDFATARDLAKFFPGLIKERHIPGVARFVQAIGLTDRTLYSKEFLYHIEGSIEELIKILDFFIMADGSAEGVVDTAADRFVLEHIWNKADFEVVVDAVARAKEVQAMVDDEWLTPDPFVISKMPREVVLALIEANILSVDLDVIDNLGGQLASFMWWSVLTVRKEFADLLPTLLRKWRGGWINSVLSSFGLRQFDSGPLMFTKVNLVLECYLQLSSETPQKRADDTLRNLDAWYPELIQEFNELKSLGEDGPILELEVARLKVQTLFAYEMATSAGLLDNNVPLDRIAEEIDIIANLYFDLLTGATEAGDAQVQLINTRLLLLAKENQVLGSVVVKFIKEYEGLVELYFND